VSTQDRSAYGPDPSRGAPRIGLVGCVKVKATEPRAAQHLYMSTLFRGRRSFVEASCCEWWVLSAKHGLVHPEETLGPYDVTLKAKSGAARREWSAQVLDAIDRRIRPAAGDVFEIHAGSEYREFGLILGLESRGCLVEVPTAGMGIGRQLQFYKTAQARRG
jgi:hypothetical protein